MTATTDPLSFDKQPYEEYKIDFNFTGRLPPGSLTLASGTLSAVKWPVGFPGLQVDATSEVLQSTSATIVADLFARALVKAGVHNFDYMITCRVITDDGGKLEDDVEMHVREKGAVS